MTTTVDLSDADPGGPNRKDTRDNIIDDLKHSLAEVIDEIAIAETHAGVVEAHLRDLHRREDNLIFTIQRLEDGAEL